MFSSRWFSTHSLHTLGLYILNHIIISQKGQECLSICLWLRCHWHLHFFKNESWNAHKFFTWNNAYLCHDIMWPNIWGQVDVCFLFHFWGPEQCWAKHCAQIVQGHLIDGLLFCNSAEIMNKQRYSFQYLFQKKKKIKTINRPTLHGDHQPTLLPIASDVHPSADQVQYWDQAIFQSKQMLNFALSQRLVRDILRHTQHVSLPAVFNDKQSFPVISETPL